MVVGMTKQEAMAEAERLANTTIGQPVQFGWHSSNLNYGHINVGGNDITDISLYGDIDKETATEESIGHWLDSVRAIVSLCNEVNHARRLREAAKVYVKEFGHLVERDYPEKSDFYTALNDYQEVTP